MKLSRELRHLLLMSLLGQVIHMYVLIFVNLYLWESNQNIFDVAWFNFVQYTLWAVSFAAGVRLLSKYTIRLLLCFAAVAGGTAFILLSLFQPGQKYIWIALVAGAVGLMLGLFSSAINLGVSMHGKSGEFSHYFGIHMVAVQLLSVSVPVVAAQVIQWFGYFGSFVMMFAVVIGMFGFAPRLPSITLKGLFDREADSPKALHWKLFFSIPGSGWLALSVLFTGVYLQFQMLCALIFTFHLTQSKTLIALLNTGYALCSLLALLAYRKWKMKESSWLYTGILFTISGFLLMLLPDAPIRVISTVLTTIGMFYFSSIWNSQLYRFINGFPPAKQAVFLVWRECLLCGGRLVMLAFIFRVEDFQGNRFAALIVLSIVCLLTIPLWQHMAFLALRRVASEDIRSGVAEQ